MNAVVSYVLAFNQNQCFMTHCKSKMKKKDSFQVKIKLPCPVLDSLKEMEMLQKGLNCSNKII